MSDKNFIIVAAMNRIEKRYLRGAERWFFSFCRTRNTVSRDGLLYQKLVGVVQIRGFCVSLELLDGFVPDKDRCIAYGVLYIGKWLHTELLVSECMSVWQVKSLFKSKSPSK